MNGIFATIYLCISLLVISSCGNSHGVVWREQVRLDTNEVITVEREFRYGGGGVGESHGPLSFARLDFSYHGKKYHWEGQWQMPILLQIDKDGDFNVASKIQYCTAWEFHGKPNSAYLIYKYVHGQWVQIGFKDFTAENRANLAGDNKRKETPLSEDNSTGSGSKRIYDTGPLGC